MAVLLSFSVLILLRVATAKETTTKQQEQQQPQHNRNNKTTKTTTIASIVTNQCVYDEFMAILNSLILCLFSFSLPFSHYFFCFVWEFV